MPRTTLQEVTFRTFTGGLNTRDNPAELSDDEFPDALNITLDERGSISKRLGYTDRYGSAIGSGLVSNLFYWGSTGKLVAQIGTGMHEDGGASFHTWSTSARVGMCEFAGKLIMVHPVDGVREWNGTAISTPTNGATRLGNTCAAWQNRVWIGGDPTQPPRLYYTDIGSAGSTSVNQFNDLREKDSALITCITGASGQDISGRPGLLVFKQDSAYRVYDSTNGAYTTIDAAIGCGSNIGAISAYGRTYTISARGIYSTDGLAPMREDSPTLEDLFHKDSINQTRPDLYCAGRYQDRLRFSFPNAGETANEISLELHPLQEWIVKHSDAASCYGTIGRNATDLTMGDPVNAGRIYNTYTGTSDNGVDIASHFQTNWKEPLGGNKTRIRRARFVGKGSFQATFMQDWALDSSLRNLDVAMEDSAAIYDSTFNYDAPTSIYGPTSFQTHNDFWSIGVFRSVAVRITEESSNDPWTLAFINLLTIELGYS